MHLVRRLLFPLLAMMALAACARDESCDLTPLAAFPLSAEWGVPAVTATIRGRPVRLLVDTGASLSVLTPGAVARLGLAANAGTISGQGLSGAVRRQAVIVDDLDLGRVDFRLRMAVTDLVWSGRGAPPDGSLGMDVLSRFDVDFDLPHGRVTLFAARACSTGAPPWQEPFDTLALDPSAAAHNRIVVPVALDGRDLSAVVDTGSTVSIVANKFVTDIPVTRPDRQVPTSAYGTTRVSLRLRRFDSLHVGSQTRAGAELGIADLPSVDFLLGLDFLGPRRLFLSVASRRLFVSYPAIRAALPVPRGG